MISSSWTRRVVFQLYLLIRVKYLFWHAGAVAASNKVRSEGRMLDDIFE